MRIPRARRLAAPLALVAALPFALQAQSWRTFDVARQLRDPAPLGVHVKFGAGRIEVQPVEGRSLFDVHLRYDAERAEPIYKFDASQRHLEVGVRHFSNVRAGRGYKGSELQVALARGVPMRLDLDIGAAEGDIDLSGLHLETLALKGGATDTRVRFDAANPLRMTQMRIDAGAASVKMHGLGHANVERIDANIGVGSLELEFGGAWHGDVHLSVTSAVGSVDLKVPASVAIRVEKTSFLHSFSAPGLEKRNGYWVSDNWDTATHKLHVRATGTLGSLEITRTGR
jgi:hypothetical protein